MDKKEKYEYFMNLREVDMEKIAETLQKTLAILGDGCDAGTPLSFEQCWNSGGITWQIYQAWHNAEVNIELHKKLVLPLKQFVDEAQPGYPNTPELYVAEMRLHADMWGEHDKGKGYDVLFGTSDRRFFLGHMEDDMKTMSWHEVEG